MTSSGMNIRADNSKSGNVGHRQGTKYRRPRYLCGVISNTVDWNLFATKYFCNFFCECSKSQKYYRKNFNDYIVITVVMNFCKNLSIAKFSHPSFLPFSQISSSPKQFQSTVFGVVCSGIHTCFYQGFTFAKNFSEHISARLHH